MGVVEVGVLDNQEQTLSGRDARVYTVHRGWLGVVTGISAASTGGVLVFLPRDVAMLARSWES